MLMSAPSSSALFTPHRVCLPRREPAARVGLSGPSTWAIGPVSGGPRRKPGGRRAARPPLTGRATDGPDDQRRARDSPGGRPARSRWGLTTGAIAVRLGIAPKTVSNLVSSILRKVCLADRNQAAAIGRDAGLGRGIPT
jgi:hypothetical protein